MEKYPKALQPTPTKNKAGKIISWRAMYADLDGNGRYKKFTWKSFPVREKLADGTEISNTKASVYQKTVEQCLKEREQFSDKVLDNNYTIIQFIDEYYREWREQTAVANNISQFIRYLEENMWHNYRLNQITEKWCIVFRANIVNFRKKNGEPFAEQKNIYIRLVAELSAILRLASQHNFIARNFNEKLPNPNKANALYKSEKAEKALRARDWNGKSWTAEQVKRNLKKIANISNTKANKVDKSILKPREANILETSTGYKTYWIDEDGNYKSKTFNAKKLGKDSALLKAEALRDEMTAEIAKEYEKEVQDFYLRETRSFRDIDTIMVEAYFTLTLHLGLRNGEVCALKFSDFDEVNKTVDIKAQLLVNRHNESKRKYDDDMMLEVAPKADSFRNISYNKYVQKVLDDLKAYNLLNDYCKYDYLLQYRFGGRVRPDYWTKHYKKFQAYAGIPKEEMLRGSHSGRHTHLTLCAQAGVPMPVLQKRAGHSRIDTTANYYMHISNDQSASDVMEEVMDENPLKEFRYSD